MTGEPRAHNRALVALWEAHREDKPVVMLLCGADGGRCRKRLGRVWATSDGLLLHYVQHVAPRRFEVDASALDSAQLADYLAREDNALRRYEPGQATAIARGLVDEDGWLALVDRPALWHPVEAGCLTHEGLVEVERDDLLDVALGAVRIGKPAEMRLRP